MAAEILSSAGPALSVQVFDAMPSVGRKFLLAGKGGLNLTHSEPPATFNSRYGDRAASLEPLLSNLGGAEMRQWAEGLGVDTFVGDPISGFALQSEDYLRMGERLAAVGLPTVLVFEGGYAVDAVGVNAVNVVQPFASL